MNNILNFVYCFDENYNKQASTSINTLVSKLENPYNIFIIHNNLSNFDKSTLINKENGSVYFYQFNNSNYDFPNIENVHVSEATYYRIFIEDYIDIEIDYLIYLDADIICINNPENYFQSKIKFMNESKIPLAANTESYRNVAIEQSFQNLDLKSNKYFNAGVLIVDFKYWKQNNVSSKLLKIMDTHKNNIVFWDQDILNIHYDGNFLELTDFVNFYLPISKFQLFSESFIKKNVIFIHYKGKPKPWNVRFASNKSSEYYHSEFRKYNNETYHLVVDNLIFDSYYFLKQLFTLNFLKTQYSLGYIFTFIKSIVDKVLKINGK
jgi:lipopolysaccharide biosynthesis glycosyltransferase